MALESEETCRTRTPLPLKFRRFSSQCSIHKRLTVIVKTMAQEMEDLA